MKAHHFLLVVLANIWLCAGLANAARITLTESEWQILRSCEATIRFDGEIKAGDLDVLKSLVDKTCNKVKKNTEGYIEYKLLLNSDGGDVSAALEIGRFIRNLSLPPTSAHFGVILGRNDRCNSSCVFLIAAGPSRRISGKVGIHRPYLVQINSNLSAADIGRIRSEQIRLIKAYLAEMDVPESLLDAMLSIPPEEMKILSESELKQYRIFHDDANFEEKRTAENAKEWYLTSAEYRKRDAEKNKTCGLPIYVTDHSTYSLCEKLTMLNISEAELKKRESKARSACLHLRSKVNNEVNTDYWMCRNKIRAGK